MPKPPDTGEFPTANGCGYIEANLNSEYPTVNDETIVAANKNLVLKYPFLSKEQKHNQICRDESKTVICWQENSREESLGRVN